MGEGRFATLKVAREGPRLTVTLDRPERRNAFDDRVVAELAEVLGEASRDEELRCLVLEGAGPVFCAGADLAWMQRMAAEGPEAGRDDARRMAAMFAALDAVPFPTVARVQGAALGGGVGLVSCVDVAIAERGARFGFTEVRLGIVPAVISAFVLRRIGRGAARRYFATGEVFDGARAEAIGLISEAVPAEDLDRRVGEVVGQVLSVGPRAARAAKRLIDEVAGAPFPEVLERTSAMIAAMRATDEAREGMAAFLARRPARWQQKERP